jgi:hypothetical protein
MADEDFDDVDVRITKRGKSKKGAQPEETPPAIENDEPIPLFPNIDKDHRNVIVSIRVWKRTPPGDGFKGDIPPTSTLDFVAKRWGNGIYDMEAMNQAQQVLRRHQNIKIDIGGLDSFTRPQGQSNELAERLLDRQATQFERDSERSKQMADKAITLTESLSTNYASMIREDSKGRIERDREFFQAQATQQANLFQGVLAQMQQMHQMSMEQQREGFQQTMQMMQVQHQHSQTMNNPMLLLSLFREGLRFGQESQGEEDPLSNILKSGVMGLGQIKDMMALQSTIKPVTLPAGKPTRSASTTPPALTREELLDLVRLKKLATAKGQDFHEMVRQAKTVLAGSPDEQQSADENDEDDEESNTDDSSDNRPSKVEGRNAAE